MALFERETVQLPGGESVEIRELSVEQLREADVIGTENITKQMDMMPQDIIDEQVRVMQAKAAEEGTKGEQEKRYEGHDQATLLQYGVLGWNFETPFSPEATKEMGYRKADIVARAIFKLTVPEAGESDASSTKSAGDASSPRSTEPTTSDEQEA